MHTGNRGSKCRWMCGFLATISLTAAAKGPLHEDHIAHVLHTGDLTPAETAFSTSDYATGNWASTMKLDGKAFPTGWDVRANKDLAVK